MRLGSDWSRRWLMAGLLCVSGCGPVSHAQSATKIGMLVRGLGDHSFSDSANAGLQAAHHRLGVAVTVLQTHDVNAYQPDLIALASEGAAQTFAIGYNMRADLADVAHRFPSVHFALVDAVLDAPNVTSITFKSEQGSFLAGALAALTSKSKTIAFLGGMDEPVIRTFEAGFIAGARQADPGVRVLVKFVGSFEDVAAGKEMAGLLYAEHADVIYAAAGSASLGVIDEARDRTGAYVIGVDADEDGLAPGKVLTSVLKRVDVSVYELCEIAAAHRTPPRSMQLGLKEGGVGLTDFRYTRRLISDATLRRIERYRMALIGGRLVAPLDPAQAAAYRPVSL